MDFTNSGPLSSFLNLPKLLLHEDRVAEWERNNPFTPKFPVKDRLSFLGIEVETENVANFLEELSPFWQMVDDGSLRNHGKEFITIPTRASRIEQALTILFNSQLNKNIDFSERTSIHVHLNVRTLTANQLASLVLSYLVFEKAIFNWVGHQREHNIFCNPLTTVPEIDGLMNKLNHIRDGFDWNKYCALNLAPIYNKGTIEFRHLYGTKDIPILMTWINMILSLKVFALKKDPNAIFKQIRELNTESQYLIFANEIFGREFAKILLDYPNAEEDCYYCVSVIKEQILESNFAKEVRKLHGSAKDNPLLAKLVEYESRKSLGTSRSVKLANVARQFTQAAEEDTPPEPEIEVAEDDEMEMAGEPEPAPRVNTTTTWFNFPNQVDAGRNFTQNDLNDVMQHFTAPAAPRRPR